MLNKHFMNFFAMDIHIKRTGVNSSYLMISMACFGKNNLRNNWFLNNLLAWML